MPKDISFIHLSDVNIGACPDAQMEWHEERAAEIRQTFKDVIEYGGVEHKDFIFITGDLFDHIPTIEDLQWLDEMCYYFPDTCFMYVTGELDYQKTGSPISDYSFKSNIIVLGRDLFENHVDENHRIYAIRNSSANCDLDIIYFPNLEIYIYGVSIFHKKFSHRSLDEVEVVDKNATNILLAHGGDENILPIDFLELKSAGFDYIALGHKHRREQIGRNIIYPGTLEPLGPEETGRHGYILGDVTGYKLSIKFIAASKREYKTINLPITEQMSEEYVVEEIIHLLKLEGSNHIYSINLVRDENVEKNFEVADALKDYRIYSITGEKFNRTDYTEYIKSNAHTTFGLLLSEMDGDSPLSRDAAKRTSDMIIEHARLNKKRGKRLSDKAFASVAKDIKQILKTERGYIAHSEEVLELEKMKKELAVSQDVLDKLNETWALERKLELEYRTAISAANEMPRVRRREKVKKAFRLVFIPLILLGLILVMIGPRQLVDLVYNRNGGNNIWPLALGIICLLICVFIIYVNTTRMGKRILKSKRNNHEADSRGNLEELKAKTEKVRAKRRELQILENQRKGLMEEAKKRERETESLYYDMQIIDGSLELLNKYANIQ